MMTSQTFAEWLETHANIIPSSIRKYSKAIGTIASELGDYGLERKDLFSLSDTTFIDTILSNPEFKKKCKRTQYV